MNDATKKKISLTQKIVIAAVVLVVLLALAIFAGNNSESKKESEPEIQYPANQTVLINASLLAIDKAKKADNDMQIGSALRERSKTICANMGPLAVEDWIGKVSEIGSNSDGLGILKIEIAKNVYLKTWNNWLSDSDHKTLIQPATPLFDAVANLKKGQKVKFSGNFFKDRNICIYESSLTLDSKVKEPEFIFKFTKVSPL